MTVAASLEATFRVRCLGPALVWGPEGDSVAFQTRKHVVLLLNLALQPGRPVSRDALTDLFWHGDEERKARHSLSQSVSLVNKAMGREVIVSAGTNRVALTEGLVSVDVAEFERRVADGEFLEARRLWGGPFLEGFWVPRAPKLEEWIAGERARLDRTFRRVLHELIEEHRSSGDHEAMRREAETLLAMDDLDEKAMLGYLESLTLLGDRTLALRRYGEFEKRLVRELEAEPCNQLRAWSRRHRRVDSPPVAPRSSRDSSTLPAVRPLFGRDSEFAHLWKAWERVRAGKGEFHVTQGAPGIGKSALCAKLANQIHVAGGAVCYVKCYGTERAVPFAPATHLARQLARLPGFLGTSATWISELARLVPELRERFPSCPEPPPFGDCTRLHLCDAVLEAVVSVAYEQPLAIVIDDVHDADEASLALFHFLGRQIDRMAVLLLCFARTDSAVTEATTTFLTSARSGGFARFATLGRIADAHIERIAVQVFAQRGMEATPKNLTQVLAAAQGNPLLAIEAAMALRPLPDARAEVSSHSPVDSDPFDSSAAERLTGMTDDARLVAGAVAIAGRPLSEYELAQVTELAPARLAVAVATLEASGIARHGAGGLAFQHERYARSAEASMQPEVRQHLHLLLARHIERTAATNPAHRIELAHHYRFAGRLRDARSQALSAARYAGSLGAMRSKADALGLALAVSGASGRRLALELASCYLSLNDLGALRALCEVERGRGGAQRADLQYFELAADFNSGAASFEQTERALLRLLGDSQVKMTYRAEAEVLLSRVADKTGNPRLVRAIARTARRRGLNCASVFMTAYLFLKYYWAERALPQMERALSMAQAERNLEIEQLSRDGVAILLKQSGRFHESIKAYEYSLGLARRTMNPYAEVTCLQNRAVSEMCVGDFDKVFATHLEAASVSAAFPNWAYKLYRRYNEGVTWIHLGDPDKALHEFKACLSDSLATGFYELARQALGGTAIAKLRIGDLNGLGDSMRVGAELGSRTHPVWIEIAAQANHLALNEGRTEAAEELIGRELAQVLRRDMSHYMALLGERALLRERFGHTGADSDRRELGAMASEYGVKPWW